MKPEENFKELLSATAWLPRLPSLSLYALYFLYVWLSPPNSLKHWCLESWNSLIYVFLEFELFSFLSIFFPEYFLFSKGIFCHWEPPLHLLSRAQGWHIHRGGSFSFFKEKNLSSNLKLTLLLMNKPSFPTSSHTLLFHESVISFTPWPWELALPSPATFPSPAARKHPYPSFRSAQVLTVLQSQPSGLKNFMTTPRPWRFLWLIS